MTARARIARTQIAMRIISGKLICHDFFNLTLPRPIGAMRRNEHPTAGERIEATMRMVREIDQSTIMPGAAIDHSASTTAEEPLCACLLTQQILHLREDQDHRGTQRHQNHRRKDQEEDREDQLDAHFASLLLCYLPEPDA